MALTEDEVRELQRRYSHLTNYQAEEPGAPIDPLTYVDSNGDALLHIAAQRGDEWTIERLLSAGVDANLIGDMGNTALHYAETEETARVLLRHGAALEICNEFGQRPRWGG